jgi:hypothetical protein
MVELRDVLRSLLQLAGIGVLSLGCSGQDTKVAGGAGGAGTAGSVGTAVTAGSVGAAGTAGSAGSLVVPCGGDLLGVWGNVNDHAVSAAPANINSCWNLNVSFSGGTYYATTRYPAADTRSTYLTFAANGHYTGAQTLTGVVTLEYAAECLVTPQGTPTCAQLQVALHASSVGEGSYFDTMCADQAGGGCTCTVRVQETGGGSGAWSTNVAAKTVTLTRDPHLPEPNQLTLGYCVDAAGVTFGDGIDAWWRQTAGAFFTKIDCTDGKQSFGEEGIDCGGQFCAPCGQP